MTTAVLELAPQQAEAIRKATAWFEDRSQQVFRLFGYAGTGKTTLARHLVEQLGCTRVVYAAFTGKAAYVLRTKGCLDARTIHSLIYLPSEKTRAKLRELHDQLAQELDPTTREIIGAQIRAEERKLETPNWILRDPDESDLTGSQLLVVDEVSMVGAPMAADLLSFDVPTLVLGDPAQLPPVEGGGWFIDTVPDHLLTDIHRSALDSPVTRLATAVRGAPAGDRLYGIPGADGHSGRAEQVSVADLLAADQVLVGTNATRWQAIHLLRALRGQLGDCPVPGDRIIALANSSDAEVFNGQQFDVIQAEVDDRYEDRVRLVVDDDEANRRLITCWRAGFQSLEGEKRAKRDGRGSVVAATFGQAITVHKAQGSQWDRVLVVDEAAVFAGIEQKTKARVRREAGLPDRGEAAAAGHLAGQRWLYTAITRAAQQVTIIPRIRGVLT
jgi:exodeoxyribonuclease-5